MESPDWLGRVVPAVLLVILLVIGGVTAINSERLESAYFDELQQQTQLKGSEQLAILEFADRDLGDESFWTSDAADQLITRLDDAGASAIVITQPLRFAELPGENQITALIRLEERARRLQQSNGELESFGEDIDSLSAQLNDLRADVQRREDIAATIRRSDKVLLALPVSEYRQAEDDRKNCLVHRVSTEAVDAEILKPVVRVQGIEAPPVKVCTASKGAGISHFPLDVDGVFRRSRMLTNVDGDFYPSLALAAASALPEGRAGIQISANESVFVGDLPLPVNERMEVINRFYNGNGDQPVFTRLKVEDVMAGLARDVVKDRIVVLGNSGALDIRTPIGEPMSPAVLTATVISNILENHFVHRPDWLRLTEIGVMAAVAVMVLLLFPGMHTLAALLAGFILATIFLAIEAYFLISENIWTQMLTPALFVALAVCMVPLWQRMTRPRKLPASAYQKGGITDPSSQDQLDLAFSVLRQQEATDTTKEQLYNIALAHAKQSEFAKSERVLTYLASIDPQYRDVTQKLAKLSGARSKVIQSPTDEPEEKAKAPVSAKRTLGRYELDEIIGRGAMATVYLGRDPKINRKVAIKTIAMAEEFSAEDLKDAKQQFMREAESAGRLNHPNIIAIYDVGEDDDIAYLAMEYFEGVALSEHALPGKLLPADWVLELIARAAEAVEYAHGQNVVHRDIKPANLMYHAASDTLKLTDFGIARLTDTSRTKTGIILGTPSYMSPEQLSATGVTGQSDLYSLGVTMYQLLVGAPPFRANSIPRLMDKIVNDKHEPVSDVRDDLPPCVDQILNVALAKDPADRYASGRAMALALRDCCSSFSSDTNR